MAGLMIAGTAANAQPTQRNMIVHVGDLNLTSATDATVALDRVHAAARQYCGHADPTNFGFGAAIRACRAYVTDQAVVMIAQPMVTALHEGAVQARRDPERKLLARR